MKSRAVVIGEVLCDLFVPTPGVSIEEAVALVPMQGGAPANVAVQLSRLGVRVELISAVGADPIGRRLIARLEDEGVGQHGLVTNRERKTGLTMVELDLEGERRFHPWRQASADFALSPEDLDESLFDEATALLHRGTVCLADPISATTSREAARRAHEVGAFVSLDVNLCFGMFDSRERLLADVKALLTGVDVAKATIEEARALFGDHGPEILSRRFHELGVRLLSITFGAQGAQLSTSEGTRVFANAPKVKVVDTTGAGDSFVGAVLADLLRRGITRDRLGSIPKDSLQEISSIATWTAAQTVTALGATTAMPRSENLAFEVVRS